MLIVGTLCCPIESAKEGTIGEEGAGELATFVEAETERGQVPAPLPYKGVCLAEEDEKKAPMGGYSGLEWRQRWTMDVTI